MSKYVDLHAHSCFSFLDAYGTPEQIVDRAKELGRNAVALTDHGTVSGFVRLEIACKKESIKPIFGCEFYCVPDSLDRSRGYFHLTVLSKNDIGLQNIYRMLSSASKNGFYYKPRIDNSILYENRDGLIILSGCHSGIFSLLAGRKEIDRMVELANVYKTTFGEDFYLEIQPFDVCYEENKIINEVSKKTGVPLVVTNDVHYLKKGQHEIQKLLYCIRQKEYWDVIDYHMPETMYMMTDDEIKDVCNQYPGIDWESGIDNTSVICEKISNYLPKEKEWSYFGDRAFNVLSEDCKEAIENRGFSSNKDYVDRMNYELGLIKDKGFSDYFLVLRDICKWCKDNDILVGPARGSSAGSLVCFLLRITEVDPIEHNLMFERFIDINRTDLPDIDTDIQSTQFLRVKDYVAKKFGDGNFALLGTFNEFKGKNTIDDVGRAFRVKSEETSILKSRLIERSIADARASFTLQDTIDKFPEAKTVVDKHPDLYRAIDLEGQYRHMGTSAAGVIVSSSPLSRFGAIYKDDIYCWDKADIEYLNLLKIDLLKLRTLDILKDIMDDIGMSIDDLYALPLNDQKVFDGFNNLNTVGIFQFDGGSGYWVVSQIKINSFREIADANAMSRPGPIYSRATHEYIKRKNIGNYDQNADEADKVIGFVTNDTFGEVLYQEQVMRVLREVGGMSWEDTGTVRKAISKSLGQEFVNQYREKFITGAMKNGISESVAEEIWKKIFTFGSWAFNLSHAVSYSMLAYYCMYFKVYYPEYFYLHLLRYESSESYIGKIIDEYLFSMGGKIKLPNINLSSANWSMESGALRMGLSQIKGFGQKTIEEIIKKRPFVDMDDLLQKTEKRIINSKIQGIISSEGMFEDKDYVSESNIFGKVRAKLNTRKIKDIGWSVENRYETMYVCGFLKNRVLYNIYEEDKIRGINKNYVNPDVQDYMMVSIVDDSGSIKGRVDRFVFAKYRELFMDSSENTVFCIRGSKPPQYRTLVIKELEVIDEGLLNSLDS